MKTWAIAVVALTVLSAGGYFGYRAYIDHRAATIRAVLGQSEPIKKESRVLVARFENLSGEPALDLTGQLIADHIRRYLPELEWVREAVTLPATEKVSADLTADDMRRLARKTGADALIAGAYHRQGDKVVLRGRVFDLARGKTWADLAPIEGPLADASAAVEEMAERLLGIASELGADRQGDRDVSVMNNFSVPQRWDSRRMNVQRAGMSPEQRDAQHRRRYELDPKGAAIALVTIAQQRAAFPRRDYAGARAALAWLRNVDPKYRFGHHVYLQAQITALLGQRDDALRLLREAKAQVTAPVEGVSLVADHVLLHPDFESLANDPDFKALFVPKG